MIEPLKGRALWEVTDNLGCIFEMTCVCPGSLLFSGHEVSGILLF